MNVWENDILNGWRTVSRRGGPIHEWENHLQRMGPPPEVRPRTAPTISPSHNRIARRRRGRVVPLIHNQFMALINREQRNQIQGRPPVHRLIPQLPPLPQPVVAPPAQRVFRPHTKTNVGRPVRRRGLRPRNNLRRPSRYRT